LGPKKNAGQTQGDSNKPYGREVKVGLCIFRAKTGHLGERERNLVGGEIVRPAHKPGGGQGGINLTNIRKMFQHN